MRVGDTSVVCGVRAEILLTNDVADYKPRSRAIPADNHDTEEGMQQAEKRRRREDTDEMARLNLLVPNLELATGCAPAHLPGGPPLPLAQTLAQRILTLLHTSQLIDLEDLRIWHYPPSLSPAEKMDTSTDNSDGDDEGENDSRPRWEIKAFWTLYIDMVFISLDGNPFDAAWGSILAALADVRLPRAWWDADLEQVLCDDDVGMSKRLRLRDIPVAMSFGVFETREAAKGKSGKWVLVDMDGFEEGLCKEAGTVVVREGGEIVRIEKIGGGQLSVEEMGEVIRLAQDRWREWRDVLERL